MIQYWPAKIFLLHIIPMWLQTDSESHVWSINWHRESHKYSEALRDNGTGGSGAHLRCNGSHVLVFFGSEVGSPLPTCGSHTFILTSSRMRFSELIRIGGDVEWIFPNTQWVLSWPTCRDHVVLLPDRRTHQPRQRHHLLCGGKELIWGVQFMLLQRYEWMQSQETCAKHQIRVFRLCKRLQCLLIAPKL